VFFQDLGWLDSFDSKKEKQSGNRIPAQCVILLYRWNRLGLAASPG